MDRRTWLQLITILTAANEANAQQRGGAAPPPAADAAGRGGRGQGNQPMRITKEQVIGALKLMGLEFQDAELDMMLRGVNSAIANYESLRKADVPIDTEPAFAFHPGLPDRQPIKGPQRFDTTIAKAPAMRAPSNLQDIAFWRVVDLAPLVKSRAVSSTDLTKMYLARMEKYSPKLLCQITSTADLAIQQAAAADKEIRAGHYRGP